jgi:hypothetical protein
MGDAAVGSSVVAFLVAGVLFMASVVAVLVTTRSGSDADATGDATDNARFGIQSEGLANVLLSSPGYYHDANGDAVVGDWTQGANPITGRTANAENLDRLGVLEGVNKGQNMVNFTKFQNLRRAGYYSANNGYVDYQEAVETLGLDDEGLNFHVRAYPSLTDLKELLARGEKDQNLRVTYLGHYDITYPTNTLNPPEPTYNLGVTAPTCAVSNDVTVTPTNTPPQGNPTGYAQNYRLQTTVTNGGSTTTQFTALFEYKLGSYQGSRVAQSYLVAPGETTPIFVDIPARLGISCPVGSTISVKITEPFGNSKSAATTLSTAVTGASTISPMRDLYLQAGQTVYTTSTCASSVQLTWSSPANDVGAQDFLGMKVVYRSNGTQVWPSTGYYTFKANSGQQAKLDGVCLKPGEYRGYLYYSGGNSFTATSEHVMTRIVVNPTAIQGYVAPGIVVTDFDNPIYHEKPPVQVETQYLDTLVERFCPTFYNSKVKSPIVAIAAGDESYWTSRCASFAAGRTLWPAQPGDVIPDFKRDMDNNLPERLLYPGDPSNPSAPRQPRYDLVDVLVVGSNVDHAAMTSGAAKFAVRDWVLGGGTILVFGSEEGNVNWLEPLFFAGIRGNGGAISTPDQGHPMLHVPNELDDPAASYDARDTVWRFNGQTARAQDDPDTAVFDNVIVVGDPQVGDPVLASSLDGAFGSGSIIVTAYTPYDLYNNDAVGLQPGGPDCPFPTKKECEGMRFMQNMLMQGYADLFLDYGPPIPEGTDVQPAIHTVQIRHPEFADPIAMTMIVYVF